MIVAACGRISFDATTGDATSDSIGDGQPADSASCFIASAAGRVTAYGFADSAMLGHDSVGTNHLTTIVGTPTPSTDVPPGHLGLSLALDGASGLCLDAGWTFDSTADHTVCWWSKQAVLPTIDNTADQFTHTCSYDTWTANSGTTYRWTINNCNSGVIQDIDVPNVYTANTWVQICQTYERAALRRTVYINGDTTNPHVVIDTDPILMPQGQYWCIGAYYFTGSGGAFWTGEIYAPIWFDRVLPAADIARIHGEACAP